MAEFLTVNIKENLQAVDVALADFLIALDDAKAQKAKALKIVHGYGSHGVGGKILLELKRILPQMKRRSEIKDYISGAEWSFANPKAFALITKVPDAALDEDLNNGNIGITIVMI